ncbi:hypothetical protein GCM10027445_64400 [Amycolatopsis endophytica]
MLRPVAGRAPVSDDHWFGTLLVSRGGLARTGDTGGTGQEQTGQRQGRESLPHVNLPRG